jgi:2-polyprenyl-6-methoxyphenol hydroxylase-like FAD-dependent oxidoreductase
VGVQVEFQHAVKSVRDLDGDLIIGADGASSIVRSAFPEEFGTQISLLTNRFSWYGTTRQFDVSHLNFKTIADGKGALCGHYSTYARGMSTFVMECDEATWFGCGLDAMTDEQRRTFTQQFFKAELGGCELIANHSVWRQFPVVINQHWHHANRYVLLGDALRTAHFSIGSGTRMALEAAIALSNSLTRFDSDVAAALNDFEQTHRPTMEKLASASERSFRWYETFRARMAQTDAAGLAYDYLMRTGRIDEARLRRDFSRFLEFYQSRHGALTTNSQRAS